MLPCWGGNVGEHFAFIANYQRRSTRMLLWVLAITDRPRDVAIPPFDRLALLPDILIYIPLRQWPIAHSLRAVDDCVSLGVLGKRCIGARHSTD